MADYNSKMNIAFDALTVPLETVKKTIWVAFDPKSNRRREALRIVQRVLDLAKVRGFENEEPFMAYFRQSKSQWSDKHTKKHLAALFEYVSVDEFAHLASQVDLLA